MNARGEQPNSWVIADIRPESARFVSPVRTLRLRHFSPVFPKLGLSVSNKVLAKLQP
jgi:hypothetical protein